MFGTLSEVLGEEIVTLFNDKLAEVVNLQNSIQQISLTEKDAISYLNFNTFIPKHLNAVKHSFEYLKVRVDQYYSLGFNEEVNIFRIKLIQLISIMSEISNAIRIQDNNLLKRYNNELLDILSSLN